MSVRTRFPAKLTQQVWVGEYDDLRLIGDELVQIGQRSAAMIAQQRAAVPPDPVTDAEFDRRAAAATWSEAVAVLGKDERTPAGPIDEVLSRCEAQRLRVHTLTMQLGCDGEDAVFLSFNREGPVTLHAWATDQSVSNAARTAIGNRLTTCRPRWDRLYAARWGIPVFLLYGAFVGTVLAVFGIKALAVPPILAVTLGTAVTLIMMALVMGLTTRVWPRFEIVTSRFGSRGAWTTGLLVGSILGATVLGIVVNLITS